MRPFSRREFTLNNLYGFPTGKLTHPLIPFMDINSLTGKSSPSVFQQIPQWKCINLSRFQYSQQPSSSVRNGGDLLPLIRTLLE